MSPKPVGGPYITGTTILAALMVAIMGTLVLARFCFGLGTVTNLNDGYSWGLWLAYDVVAGTAIGCGGYTIALVVYVLNKGHYHPLVRPAILASMFGYAIGGTSVLIDISRWWNFWHILWPTYFNLNSVMIEVALCISIYTTVLILEFAPAVVEKVAGWTWQRGGNLHVLTTTVEKVLDKTIFVLVALGMTLPTMHQSSLGTMLIPFGYFINPLWQTPILPALYLLTALSIGYAIVMFEATLVSDRFARPSEARILGLLSRYMAAVGALFLLVRCIDILYRGKVHYIFTSHGLGFAFLGENLLILIAIILLLSEHRRLAPRYQFIAAMCIMSGCVLYRIDSYLVAYHRAGWHYFPSAPEILITFGMIAVEVLGYILIVRHFPVLYSAKHVNAQALATE